MRAKIIAAAGLVAATFIALGSPASAGENMHVDVNKVVVGTAPAGTKFTVHYACSDGGPSGDLSFDATGNPVPASDNFFNDGILGTTCTLTETATGGATNVSFTCHDDGVNASCSASGDSVTFDSPTNLSNNVTFTVTNTFAEPVPTTAGPTTTGSTAPAVPEPATAVVATPVFTG